VRSGPGCRCARKPKRAQLPPELEVDRSRLIKMQTDFYDQIHVLQTAGNPFAIATVVRAEKPTSAKAGSRAIITEDGTLSGWVGGSCAEPTVKREAKKALQDGQPRFIRLCPAEKMGQAPQEGVIEIALTCISGGTLEIYIEPQLAQPHLIVIGHLATAESLVRLAKDLGWRVSLMGLDITRERFPDADHLVEELDFSKLPVTKNTYIVVASHGNYDEDMLVAALQSEAPYVALIASKKRASAILQYLNETNLAQEQIARLKYPAGLDFGAVTPEEIALSILAEIIQQRRQLPITNLQFPREASNSLISDPLISTLQLPITQNSSLEALDPVCGMTVEIATAHFTSQYEGKTYYFCAAGCKRFFDKEPSKYIQTESSQM
jgi:xanthine dehydrogenase accessory factor